MIAFLILTACGDGAPALDSASPKVGPCTSVPRLTWENFGQSFMLENCQTCHASGTLYRDQASTPPPAHLTFDTHADVIGSRDAILSSATGDSPRMPPEGGVSPLDREKLEIWIDCWEGE
jgi:hypothetical protein